MVQKYTFYSSVLNQIQSCNIFFSSNSKTSRQENSLKKLLKQLFFASRQNMNEKLCGKVT